MRSSKHRGWLVVFALLALGVLMLAASCRKQYYRDTPEEEEPRPGPTPPGPPR